MNTWTRPVDAFATYPRLEDLLQCIEVGETLSWRWKYLWATALSTAQESMVSLEAKIQGTPGGLECSYVEVLALCANFDQVIDCQLLGLVEHVPERDFVEIEISDSSDVIIQWGDQVEVDVSALGALVV